MIAFRMKVVMAYLDHGEQHGFRKSVNIERALDTELYFYAALLFRSGLQVLTRQRRRPLAVIAIAPPEAIQGRMGWQGPTAPG
jgi:hypothetical protein